MKFTLLPAYENSHHLSPRVICTQGIQFRCVRFAIEAPSPPSNAGFSSFSASGFQISDPSLITVHGARDRNQAPDRFPGRPPGSKTNTHVCQLSARLHSSVPSNSLLRQPGLFKSYTADERSSTTCAYSFFKTNSHTPHWNGNSVNRSNQSYILPTTDVCWLLTPGQPPACFPNLVSGTLILPADRYEFPHRPRLISGTCFPGRPPGSKTNIHVCQPSKKFCVEQVPHELASDSADDTGFLNFYGNSGIADWEETQDADIAQTDASTMIFDLGNHFNMRPISGGSGYDDQLSLPSFKTATSNATKAAAGTPPTQVLYDSDDTSDTTSLTGGDTVTSSRSAPPNTAVLTASAQQTRVTARNVR